MRLLGYALVVLVCSWSVAFAQAKKGGAKAPKPGPTQKQPTPNAPKKVDPKLEAELQKLDREYSEHSMKQAYVPAMKVAEKLYELQLKATGPDSIEVERRKQSLAYAYETASNHAAAEKLFVEIIRDAERKKGADSREVAQALVPLVGIYNVQQRYDEAEPAMLRLLALIKKLDGEKSREFAQQLQQYGTLLYWKNEFAASLRTYEDSLRIYEAIAKSKDDGDLISPLQLLGTMYWQANQHAKSIATFDRAMKIADKAVDQMFVLRVMVVWGAAMQYHFGGRKDLADPLFKKAISQTEAELARLEKTAPDDWQIQSLQGQLGFMYRYNNDLVKAEEAYLKVIKMAEKKGHTSGYEGMLADLKRLQGKNKEAIALLEAANAAMKKIAPNSANAYDPTIAEVAKEMGDYKRAIALLEPNVARSAKQFGTKSPYYGFSLMSLAHVYALAGKIKEAEKAYDAALDISERDLKMALRTGTDADHAVYFTKNAYVLDVAIHFNLTYAPTSGTASRFALTTLLRRKGRILDAAAAVLATIRSKLSADDKKLLDELAAMRAQLSTLMVSGPKATGGDVDAFLKEVAALEDKIQRVEGQVAKKSAAYQAVTQPIELATIQKAIPKDARLIEVVNYQPHDLKTPYSKAMSMQYPSRRYLAYIVGQNGDPQFVELGEAAVIDAAIEKFRKALSDPDNDSVIDLGKGLYDLTLAKIIPKLGGSTNILIAPDGALNVVPFSALVDDKKEFLIKKYTFTYLTSGRDLLRLKVKTKAQGGGVLFADPKFDGTGAAAPKDPNNKTRGKRSQDLASLQWPQLPGTAAEADAVSKTFKGLKVYRGDDATEGTLKGVHGPKILHLATHGFFLPDEKPPADAAPSGGAQVTMGPGGAPRQAGPAQAQTENPLLRSGLALAGANKLSSGTEDGLLTALEASGLDLWGTKLVVLSACETGVGKVTNGDGVYGLRRSLVIAGAESLVMSMWQVDDFATKELMAGFYKRLAAGKPRSNALREVQLELLGNKKYAHPFYWAAFLPAGATTPLKD